MTNQIQAYLQEVMQIYQKGNATEHTYRPALKKLLESFDNNILAVNEPKRIACGAPDFWIGQGALEIGHLEAKDIGISLKGLEKKDQMKRYFNALGNLILTDHLEFRWYVDGELRLAASIATFDKQKKIKPDADGIVQVDQLLRQFLLTKVVQVTTPKALAKRMAALAQLIRDAINTALNDSDRGGMLRQQLESFRAVLIRDLTGEQFADMYAQTICYGLFAARCNTDQVSTFSRETAGFRLPKTNPFLRGIFNQIAGSELDDRIVWAVDTLATILQQTDMSAILSDFGKRDRREDPVVHFYETFLAEYDPKMRESRGVYYTPEPVVGYIVRSVDYILKEKFAIKKGLADSTKIPYPPQSPLAKGGGTDSSSSPLKKGSLDSSSPPSQGGVRGGFDITEIILDRLVTLNAQRAEEERNGHIRWLRPEYQAPNEVRTQTIIEGVGESEEVAIAPAEVKTFPKQPKDQLAAIRDLLRTSNNPWTIAQIAAQFKNGGRYKNAISENLERLEWFGILHCHQEAQIKYWQHIETQQAS